MNVSSSASYRFFARWAAFSYNQSLWVIFMAIVIAGFSVVYTANNLGVHTDTTDMLSEDVPFRINHKRYKEAFPQYEDALLLVVDAPTPEQSHSTAKQLTTRLQEDKANIHEASYLSGEPFFEENGLLYQSIPELENITDRLAAAQPLIARLAENSTLDTFASVLTQAVDEANHGRNLDLDGVYKSISATLDARLADTPRPLSWQLLLNGEKQTGPYQEVILARPKLDYTQLFAAEASMQAVRDTAETLGITSQSDKNLRITGEAALAYDELHSAMRGAQDAGLLALVLVVAVLFLALRTFGAILTVLFSLVLGLLLTAAFATLAIGHLNLISIAFAVLYIGLGVDYAIHFLLRHEEIRRSALPVAQTLPTASGDIGTALMICAITSAIGFYAFIPTNYDGVAELGLISGTGMIISLLVTLTVVPALQRFFPIRTIKPLITDQSVSITEWPVRARKKIYILTTIAIIVAAFTLPQIKFDYNLLNLNDPDAESVEAFRDLLANAENSPWHSIALAENKKEAEVLSAQLATLPEVDKVVTILDFVPDKQEQKSQLIEEMGMILGPISFSSSTQAPIDVAAQRTALQNLKKALARFLAGQPQKTDTTAADALLASITDLLLRLEKLNQKNSSSENDSTQAQLLSSVEQDLLRLLPISIHRLQLALQATPFTQQAIPESIRTHWQSKDDMYRVAIYPAGDISNNKALKRFVRAVQEVVPGATGVPVISLEAGKAVVDAFIHAFSLAMAGVVIALLILLRNVKSTILVLLPLLLAAIFTGAATVLLDVPFNFANVIALPLILGIGIDCSVHMVHRSRSNGAQKKNVNLLHTSTARAIFYSALTTMAGFGSLIFSQHQGTASMGLLLLAGVLLMLACVLIILPALLYTSQKKDLATKIK